VDASSRVRLELVRSLYDLLRAEIEVKPWLHPVGQLEAIERYCQRIIELLEAAYRDSRES
jgi:hypothetical protein